MHWSLELYRQGLLSAVEQRLTEAPRANGAEPLALDDHQQEAMQEVANALRVRRLRAFSIVHSCGAGKTVLEANLVGASQESKRSCGEGGDRCDLVLVSERAVLTSVEEEFGEFVDPADIGVWGMGRKSLDRPVVIATIQALQRSVRELAKHLPLDRTDLLIGDEADTYLTEARKKIVEQFQGALRVGFTATPQWPDGRDIEQLWGSKIHRLPLDEAILRGVNVPPFWKLYASSIAEENLRLRGGDYEEKVLAAALRSAEIHKAIAPLYRTIVPRERRSEFPTMVFVPSTALVEAVTTTLREELGAEGVTIQGWTGETVTDWQMEKDIAMFEGGRLHVLVLCEMAGRGIDLPMARVLIDAYPTLSRTKLEHRCGRVMRRMRSGGKPFSIVIQIHPQSTRFRPLTLPDLLGERAWEDARRGHPLLSGDAEDPGAPVTAEVEALRKRIEQGNPPHSLELVTDLDVYLHLEERRGWKSWDERLAELRAFQEAHAGKRPSEDSKDDAERSLATWVRNQRAALRDGRLTEEQAAELTALGVEAAKITQTWDNRLEELRAFQEAHAGKRPSEGSKDATERSLAKWVKNQRAALRDGRLTEEQAAELTALGVEAAKITQTRDDRLKELRAFQEAHAGEWPSEGSKDATERSLAIWVQSQRIALRDGRLTEEQAAELTALGVKPAKRRER